jgi:hypothetical protein
MLPLFSTRDVWLQWMLGEALLISPVLQPDTQEVVAYFPAGTWYSLWDDSQVNGPATATLNAPLGDVPVHVRGGAIIAMQQPGNTTHAVRVSPVSLIVALPAAATATAAVTKGSVTAAQEIKGGAVGAAGTQAAPGNKVLGSIRVAPAPGGIVRELSQGIGVKSSHGSASSKAVAAEAVRGVQPGPAYHQHLQCQHLLKHGRAVLAEKYSQLGQAGGNEPLARESCGALYLDEGESIEVGDDGAVTAWFAAVASGDGRSGAVVVEGLESAGTVRRNGQDGEVRVEEVRVLGVGFAGQVEVWVDEKPVAAANVAVNGEGRVLVVNGLSVELNGVSVLRWKVGEPKMEVIAKAT